MSACNAFIAEKRAVMLTDASVYNADGVIIGFIRKAIPVESWTGVISARGNMWSLPVTVGLAEEFASFDEFIARTGPLIEAGHRQAVAAGHLLGQTMIEVTVIGWSERQDRAMGFGLTSDPAGPAYVWRDICDGEETGYAVGPCIEEPVEEWRLHRVGADTCDYEPEEFDPIRHGLPLMEAQRRGLTDRAFFAGEPFHCVGGHVCCSIVTRQGVTQEIIREWSDEIGEPIRPAAVDDDALPRIAPSFVPKDRASQSQWFEARRRGFIDPVTLMPRKMARAS